jgi:hypothetical protein
MTAEPQIRIQQIRSELMMMAKLDAAAANSLLAGLEKLADIRETLKRIEDEDKRTPKGLKNDAVR